jgi:hypothetical protein
VAVAAAAILAGTARAAGLAPGSYVQDGLVTQFDAIDNEDTVAFSPAYATFNPDGTFEVTPAKKLR